MPILSLKDLSYQSLRQDFLDYVASRADYSSWKDVLESSAGTTFLEMLAGFGAYINYEALAARRESYLSTARLRSSVVDLSTTLGYNVNRPIAPTFQLTLNVNEPFILRRSEQFGTLFTQPLVPLIDQTVGVGLQTITVAMGEWRRAAFDVANPAPYQRVFVEDPTIDDMLNDRVILSVKHIGEVNPEVIPMTYDPEDLLRGTPLSAPEVFNNTDVDTAADRLVTTRQHYAGEAVRFYPVTGSLPLPLSSDYIYYLVPAEEGFLRVAYTYEQATNPFPATVDILQAGALPTNLALPGGTFRAVPIGLGLTSASRTVLARTFADGLQITFGDGIFGRALQNNDRVQVDYLHCVTSVAFLDIQPTDVKLNTTSAVCVAVPGYDRGSDEDGQDKLVALAPAYLGAQRNMVTRGDHTAIFMGYSGDMVSANAKKDDSPNAECCNILMCYLFTAFPNGSERRTTSAEKQDMLAYLERFRHEGESLTIVDPVRVTLQLKLTVVTDGSLSPLEVQGKLFAAILPLTQKLGTVFYIGDVAKAIAEVDSVIRPYIHYPVSDRKQLWNEYVFLDQQFFKDNLTITTDLNNLEFVTSPAPAGYV